MQEHIHTEILIVGAGLAGLMAAHTLREAGQQVLVCEKAHEVGGRLATRAVGPGYADVGAQFFTARTPQFHTWVDRWREADLVYEWAQGWSNGSLNGAPSTGHPRYAVRGGMQALAEHLAAGLPITLNANLTVITQRDHGWLAIDDQGRLYDADALILTPPVPMVLPLLRAGEVTLGEMDYEMLRAIAYAPCLAGVFWVNGTVNLPEPGAVQQHNAAISWVADNRRKGISPEAGVITVHAGPSYSRDLWPRPDWEVLAALESGLRRYQDINAQIVDRHLFRWRYANPLTVHPAHYLMAHGLPPLVFAGDAFSGPRVEGAFRSGVAAGETLAAL
jgi:renalase